MTTNDRAPLRISINPSSSTRRLDGAWWPQSRDLQAEGADLIDNFPSNIGRPARLLFSPPDWDTEPDRPSTRRIKAQRGFVKVGSFPEDDTHLVTVILSSRERLELLVIPSSTHTATARTLMDAATDERNILSAADLLVAASAGPPNKGAESEEATWENDGGTRPQAT
ncbi:hypothetical protein BJ993_004831 [Nocardioides aromaticivorans]|uniref:Uncharacterized protein n=1 Tax=Nocardioides aromaticivorans TaxID=200618 RepID=A0A7Y9ZMT7_9ACTN|nr:DUF5994 family protein [Nocardioides aromaticivorans]NYI47751.1 hypothetical protein [Nocardioides aromaticivorans]